MATVTVKETIENARHRMESAIESVRKEFTSLRAGRANASMLDSIKVDYYGTATPLNQVGNIAVPDPSLITIQPWEASLLPVIEKAIRTAGLDLNPANDGKIIRIPIPSPTEERRKGLVKLAHKAAEEGKVAVRNVRRDANDHIKKMKKGSEISEDEEKQGEAEIQKLTDSLVSKIDEMLKKKEAEVLHV
jgi:ribosome recycling factor